MTTVLRISKGETFYVDERNQISRPELMREYSNVGQGAPDWTLEGAKEYKVVFGRWSLIKSYTVTDIRLGRVPWLWKNGTQRCFIVDQDHGHIRMWLSPTPYQVWSEIITRDSILKEMLSLHDASRLDKVQSVGLIYADGTLDVLHPSAGCPTMYNDPVPIRPHIKALNPLQQTLLPLPGQAFGMQCGIYTPKVAAVLRELLGHAYGEGSDI